VPKQIGSKVPKQLTEAEREQFLAETHVAVLSVAATGRPPASAPIWYDYTPGGNISVNTAAGKRKAKLIEQVREVTLVVQREEPPYRYVVVEGTVIAATTPVPVDRVQTTAIRYLGEQGGREFAKDYTGHDSVLFTIRPDRWFTAGFSD
jgi:uncharacterized protein